MKILAGCDGTKSAKKALEVAIQMATAFNACLFIIASVSDSDDSKETFEFIEDDTKKKHKAIDKAEKDLAEAAKIVGKTGLRYETHLLNRGLKAGEDIVEYAEEAKVDFIVIGIHKTSKVGKLLFGSTAQYVILKAHCPVVTGR